MNDNDRRKYLRLLDEKRILELENDIAELRVKKDTDIDELTMSNQSIDREALNHIDAIVYGFVTTSLSIHKDIAAIKSMELVENTIEKWRENRDNTIDEGCTGCCKVVDIAADLQKKLDMATMMYHTYAEQCSNQGSTIKTIESELSTRNETINDLREQIHNQATSIDGLIKNDERMNTLIEGLEAELTARRKDSEALKKVIEIIMDESVDNSKAAWLITKVVEDYIDPPEGQIDTPIDEPNEITVKIAWLELP